MEAADRRGPRPALRLLDALLALLRLRLPRELLLAVLERLLQVEGLQACCGCRRRVRALREGELHRPDVPTIPAGRVGDAGNLDRSRGEPLVAALERLPLIDDRAGGGWPEVGGVAAIQAERLELWIHAGDVGTAEPTGVAGVESRRSRGFDQVEARVEISMQVGVPGADQVVGDDRVVEVPGAIDAAAVLIDTTAHVRRVTGDRRAVDESGDVAGHATPSAARVAGNRRGADGADALVSIDPAADIVGVVAGDRRVGDRAICALLRVGAPQIDRAALVAGGVAGEEGVVEPELRVVVENRATVVGVTVRELQPSDHDPIPIGPLDVEDPVAVVAG